MDRAMTVSTRLIAGALVLAMAGCFVNPDRDGGPGDGGTVTDPHEGQVCPAGEPHLLIGLRATVYSETSLVVRRDAGLSPCRGLLFESDQGDLTALGGTSGGYDLLGFDSGRVYLVDGAETLWGIEHPDYGIEAGSVFTMTYDGREVVVVLWVDSYDSGEAIELREVESGDGIIAFDTPYDLDRAGPAVTAQGDRFAGLLGDGVQEYRIDPTAESLGTSGERQVAVPWAGGTYNDLATSSTQSLIASKRGVLYWPHEESVAFLGPVSCRWPALVGGSVIDHEESYEYLAVDIDRGGDDRFLAVVEGQLAGATERGSYLVRLSRRSECEILTTADEDHSIVAVAWSGL